MSTKVAVRNVAQVRVGTDHLDASGGDARAVKFATITMAANAGSATIVAAVTGKKIRVLKVWAQGGTTGADLTVQFKSATTALTGVMPVSGTAGTVLAMESQFGLFETAKSALLNITTTGTNDALNGYLVYVEV